MARQAWVLAVMLVACGGSSGDSGIFESGGDGTDHDGGGGVGGSGDADSGDAGYGGFGERVCAPGKVEACACPGGGQGAQACRQDGAGWEACECGDGGAGGNGGDGGFNNGGDSDPLPYNCETTFACGCTPDQGDTWCINDKNNNPAYTNLYHGCTGRPKHCKGVVGQAGWWCCKY